MRRYALFSSVLMIVALFVVAWVNAQDNFRPRSSRSESGGDYLPSAEVSAAPQRFALESDAAPLQAEEFEEETETDSANVLPVAGTGSSAANMVAAAPNGNIPSVLKKRAGTPPTGTAVATRPTPQITPIVEGEEAPLSEERLGSSRRISPSSRPLLAPPSELTQDQSAAELTPQPEPVSRHPRVASVPTGGPVRASATSARLVLEAVGPKAVTVGKLASYEVRVANDSDRTADDVQVRISIPAWVEVRGGEGSRGEAAQEKDAAGRSLLTWNLDQLTGGSKEQLSLELVVLQNQPFELGMECSSRPLVVATEVAVQEPQVSVRLEGPSDMLFGEQRTFTLHVSNPGTGDAEGVVVEVASGSGTANRLEVGMLAAGQQKQIPFTVAATAPGEMEIRATANGLGGLTSNASSRVTVHKAELQVAMGVSPLHFAGTEATFQVAVANVGDAVAEQVTLRVALPGGSTYLAGLDGAAKAADGMTLKVGNLAPQTEKVFEIQCVLNQAGENHFEAVAQGKGNLLASQLAATNVEALANLKLQVSEPTGPIVVGGEALYEVRVVNRGTKSATGVKIVVQFAEGLEPSEAIGAASKLASGQAVFEPLAEILPGKEVVLKVKTRAEKAGNHAFRVEVKAGEPETKLVSEGVTRCFSESGGNRAVARKPAALQEPTPAGNYR